MSAQTTLTEPPEPVVMGGLARIAENDDGPPRLMRPSSSSAEESMLQAALAQSLNSAGELRDTLASPRTGSSFNSLSLPVDFQQEEEQLAEALRESMAEVLPKRVASKVQDSPELSSSDLAAARELERYTEPESVWAALRAGYVRLLRASWLIALGKSGGVLARRQELPEEAFIGVDELLQIYAGPPQSVAGTPATTPQSVAGTPAAATPGTAIPGTPAPATPQSVAGTPAAATPGVAAAGVTGEPNQADVSSERSLLSDRGTPRSEAGDSSGRRSWDIARAAHRTSEDERAAQEPGARLSQVVTAATAAAIAKSRNRDGVLPIVAISFCWDKPWHPDPVGRQLGHTLHA